MRQELKRLIKLQEMDQTIVKLRVGKSNLAAQSARAEEDAAAAKQRLAGRTSESTSFRSALDAREVDLQGIEEKIARLNGQLNLVKTNKEYSALQHEIMGLKADKSKAEDDILQMMDQIETDKAELARLKKEAAESEKACEERKKAMQTAIDDSDARTERVTAERNELAVQIPRNYLGPYERLRRKGDGRAMAACRNFVCEACRMSLTANTVNLLMAGERLVFCHSCGRILYIASDEDIHGGIGAGRKE